MYVEVLCDKLADGFVCGPIDWRGLDLDFVATVGKLRYAFSFATRMNLDVDSHGVLGERIAVVWRHDGSFERLLVLLVVFHGGK